MICKATFIITNPSRSSNRIKKGTFPDLDAAIRMAKRITDHIEVDHVHLSATVKADGLVGTFHENY